MGLNLYKWWGLAYRLYQLIAAVALLNAGLALAVLAAGGFSRDTFIGFLAHYTAAGSVVWLFWAVEALLVQKPRENSRYVLLLLPFWPFLAASILGTPYHESWGRYHQAKIYDLRHRRAA